MIKKPTVELIEQYAAQYTTAQLLKMAFNMLDRARIEMLAAPELDQFLCDNTTFEVIRWRVEHPVKDKVAS